MLKNIANKLFLMLVLAVFALILCFGFGKGVDATLVRIYPSSDTVIPCSVVNNRSDLVTLIDDDVTEKYDDDFFKKRSVLVFRVVESSGGNISVIESYEIKDGTLFVNIKQKKQGFSMDMQDWLYILTLSNKEVAAFENIRIFRDGKEIINKTKTM